MPHQARSTVFTAVFTAVAPWLTLGLLTNCGSVEQTDMFGRSSGALVENLGESCTSDPFTGSEVVVEDTNEQCMPGYCVVREDTGAEAGEGICTCRCSGPEGSGPLCDCAKGYVCEELIKSFGLGSEHLVGAYCMPEP